jgi:hypothetical protein
MRLSLIFAATLLPFFNSPLPAQQRLITQGNDKLAIVGKDGKIEWEMKWGVSLHTTPLGNWPFALDPS